MVRAVNMVIAAVLTRAVCLAIRRIDREMKLPKSKKIKLDAETLRTHRIRSGGFMKVSELIDKLQEFAPDAEVLLDDGLRSFVSPTWVGMMDTAGLFDEEKDFQLVISLNEPEEYLKLGSDPAATEQKKLRAREAARKLADMGGTMPELQPIPRRRPPRK